MCKSRAYYVMHNGKSGVPLGVETDRPTESFSQLNRYSLNRNFT